MARKRPQTTKKETGSGESGPASHDARHQEGTAKDRADNLRKQPTHRSKPATSQKAAHNLSDLDTHEASHELSDTHADIQPHPYGLWGRLVYRVSYAMSYGVVFPAMLVAHAVPASNPVVQGLLDGASAARERAETFWMSPKMALEHNPSATFSSA
jgi:hypothetical protein